MRPTEPQPEDRQDQETLPHDRVGEVEGGRIMRAEVEQVREARQVERNQEGHADDQSDELSSPASGIGQDGRREEGNRQESGAAVVDLVGKAARVADHGRHPGRLHS